MIIWLDPYDNSSFKKEIHQLIEHGLDNNRVADIIHIPSVWEFKEWLIKHSSHNIRKIITNAFRDEDGWSNTPINTIGFVRTHNELKDIPILIYTNSHKHKCIESCQNMVWITDKPNSVINFINDDIIPFDKIVGALLGSIVGDAFGSPYEFMPKNSYKVKKGMGKGGYYNLEKGQWSDNSSFILCVLYSIIKTKAYVLTDIMDKLVLWLKEGFMSSTGYAFDIGNTTKTALELYDMQSEYKNPLCGDPNSKATNGALPRVIVLSLYFYIKDRKNMVQICADSSKLTHGHPECVKACRYLAEIMDMIITGNYKKQFMDLDKKELEGRGGPLNLLRCVLWALDSTNNFNDGLTQITSLGWETNSLGAIYGGIAGFYYGYRDIDKAWKSRVYPSCEIMEIISKFYGLLFDY